MKKIVGAVWKLPAKQHSQSSPFSPKLGWIGCAIQQATSKRLPGFFFRFNILIFIYFLKYKTIETHARAFLRLNISAVSSVKRSRFKNANASMIRNDMNYTSLFPILRILLLLEKVSDSMSLKKSSVFQSLRCKQGADLST